MAERISIPGPMTEEEVLKRQDLNCVHYAPAGQTPWCKAWVRAFERNDGSWTKAKTKTDVSRVTCPACIRLIKDALRG